MIVYLHGGALICGSRKSVNAAHLHAYLRAGFAVVSIGYRLAPEKQPGMTGEPLREEGRTVGNIGITPRSDAPAQLQLCPRVTERKQPAP